ncbi:hypothetical protein SSP531S_33950 [Streptomyces spongiicola]|uniref:Uncharacterized protein n=1 Tax=Streptomyces spongiicola TaxID=1690221 RepID=A0A388T039_9ACTN|nr:hypothetical protein SSP531S_33950 [Streptomyces spongiicola]
MGSHSPSAPHTPPVTLLSQVHDKRLAGRRASAQAIIFVGTEIQPEFPRRCRAAASGAVSNFRHTLSPKVRAD